MDRYQRDTILVSMIVVGLVLIAVALIAGILSFLEDGGQISEDNAITPILLLIVGSLSAIAGYLLKRRPPES